MNGNLNSSQSELLHSYLDGEASFTEEQVLFSALAENEDLRNEMRDLLAIRNAIHSDKEAFTPPLAATAAIFAGLGFAAPSTASAMTTAPTHVPQSMPIEPSSSSMAGSFFGSIARPFIGAVIGSVVTATVATTVLTGNASENAAPMQQLPEPSIQLVQEVPPVPALSDLWIDVSEKPADIAETPAAAIADTDQQEIPIQWNAVSCYKPEPTETVSSENISSAVREVKTIASKYFGTEKEKQNHFMVQLLNTPLSYSFPSSNVASDDNPYLLNMRGSIFYVADEHHSFGVEIGREVFSQVFNQSPVGTSSIIGETEQNPIKMWITAAYRYQSGELRAIPGLHGFVQANIGGVNEIGPHGRGIVGVQYNLAPGLLFQVGVEGNIVIYKLDNAFYTTRKVGLLYGLSFLF